MALLAIDIGTTHCKAAVFAEDNPLPLSVVSRPTPLGCAAPGCSCYRPDDLWQAVLELMEEALSAARGAAIAAIGVASMAETGLVVERRTGKPLSLILPWFDTAAARQADLIRERGTDQERFSRFGIYPSFKCSLAKILWLREQSPQLLSDGVVWLSIADFITHRLTGAYATDYSLAGRTYAFSLNNCEWDAAWLAEFGLTADLFPPAVPAGTVAGAVTGGSKKIPAGTPVVIAGHDHVCGAFAAGTGAPGQAFDSMGTAEVLIGAMEERRLGPAEFDCGLTFGRMPGRQTMYWLGGLSSSGGSVEWLRGILGDPPLSYRELTALLSQTESGPGSIFYLPYLSGRGAPDPDPKARAAFIGLDARHGRGDLVKAVLEGTAYQMQMIRSAAQGIVGRRVNDITVGGGGTQSEPWLQIKADVYGVPLKLLPSSEVTLLGAALLAGIGAGVYSVAAEARSAMGAVCASVTPDPARHLAYEKALQRAQAYSSGVALSAGSNGSRS